LRFLLRGSALLLVMLAVWWGVVLGPLLAAMRTSTGLVLRLLAGRGSAGGVTVDARGDWILQVPVPGSVAVRDSVQQVFGHVAGTPLVKVRSFKLAVERRIPTFFTLSFPLFWALVLAGPRARHWWRIATIGTALLAVLAMLSLLAYTAYTIATTFQLIRPDSLWNSAEYLNLNVVSYLAPLLMALGLHGELRAQIFDGDPPDATPASVAAPAEKPRRGRYRGR
jgi:hypothetical protein